MQNIKSIVFEEINEKLKMEESGSNEKKNQSMAPGFGSTTGNQDASANPMNISEFLTFAQRISRGSNGQTTNEGTLLKNQVTMNGQQLGADASNSEIMDMRIAEQEMELMMNDSCRNNLGPEVDHLDEMDEEGIGSSIPNHP